MNIENPQLFIANNIRFEPILVTSPTDTSRAFQRIAERLGLHV